VLLNNRSLKTVQKQIQKLVDTNLIERIGSKKTGGYHIKNTQGKN
jgi:predicted transcriptional regulator